MKNCFAGVVVVFENTKTNGTSFPPKKKFGYIWRQKLKKLCKKRGITQTYPQYSTKFWQERIKLFSRKVKTIKM